MANLSFHRAFVFVRRFPPSTSHSGHQVHEAFDSGDNIEGRWQSRSRLKITDPQLCSCKFPLSKNIFWINLSENTCHKHGIGVIKVCRFGKTSCKILPSAILTLFVTRLFKVCRKWKLEWSTEFDQSRLFQRRSNLQRTCRKSLQLQFIAKPNQDLGLAAIKSKKL